jgi:hypothetical protein
MPFPTSTRFWPIAEAALSERKRVRRRRIAKVSHLAGAVRPVPRFRAARLLVVVLP